MPQPPDGNNAQGTPEQGENMPKAVNSDEYQVGEDLYRSLAISKAEASAKGLIEA